MRASSGRRVVRISASRSYFQLDCPNNKRYRSQAGTFYQIDASGASGLGGCRGKSGLEGCDGQPGMDGQPGHSGGDVVVQFLAQDSDLCYLVPHISVAGGSGGRGGFGGRAGRGGKPGKDGADGAPGSAGSIAYELLSAWGSAAVHTYQKPCLPEIAFAHHEVAPFPGEYAFSYRVVDPSEARGENRMPIPIRRLVVRITVKQDDDLLYQALMMHADADWEKHFTVNISELKMGAQQPYAGKLHFQFEPILPRVDYHFRPVEFEVNCRYPASFERIDAPVDKLMSRMQYLFRLSGDLPDDTYQLRHEAPAVQLSAEVLDGAQQLLTVEPGRADRFELRSTLRVKHAGQWHDIQYLRQWYGFGQPFHLTRDAVILVVVGPTVPAETIQSIESAFARVSIPYALWDVGYYGGFDPFVDVPGHGVLASLFAKQSVLCVGWPLRSRPIEARACYRWIVQYCVKATFVSVSGCEMDDRIHVPKARPCVMNAGDANDVFGGIQGSRLQVRRYLAEEQKVFGAVDLYHDGVITLGRQGRSIARRVKQLRQMAESIFDDPAYVSVFYGGHYREHANYHCFHIRLLPISVVPRYFGALADVLGEQRLFDALSLFSVGKLGDADRLGAVRLYDLVVEQFQQQQDAVLRRTQGASSPALTDQLVSYRLVHLRAVLSQVSKLDGDALTIRLALLARVYVFAKLVQHQLAGWRSGLMARDNVVKRVSRHLIRACARSAGVSIAFERILAEVKHEMLASGRGQSYFADYVSAHHLPSRPGCHMLFPSTHAACFYQSDVVEYDADKRPEIPLSRPLQGREDAFC